jgi:hypothetical protein
MSEDMLNFAKSNPKLAHVLETLVLVLVLTLLAHFKSAHDRDRAARRRRRQSTSNAAHAAFYRELASDMFGTAALPHDTLFADFKRRHELAARRLLPQLFA